jgi:hypothetical protein
VSKGSAMRDQETRGRLVAVLREAGVVQPQKIADAIATMINAKIITSEGRHHARWHKEPTQASGEAKS